jgi:SPP1 family predicted phage head-tail adaptor
MRAGTLRSSVIIQRKTVTGQDSRGADVIDWTTDVDGPFWANVEALQGRQLEAVQQTWAEARFRVTIRYQPGIAIARADRLLWGTRVLDILDAEEPDQRHRQVVMICKELVE